MKPIIDPRPKEAKLYNLGVFMGAYLFVMGLYSGLLLMTVVGVMILIISVLVDAWWSAKHPEVLRSMHD